MYVHLPWVDMRACPFCHPESVPLQVSFTKEMKPVVRMKFGGLYTPFFECLCAGGPGNIASVLSFCVCVYVCFKL